MSFNILPFTVEPADSFTINDNKMYDTLGGIQRTLEGFAEKHPEITHVYITNTDGQVIASVLKENYLGPACNLFKTSNSILSLAVNISADIFAGKQNIVILANADRNVLLLSLFGGNQTLNLTVISRADKSIGHALWVVRFIKDEIEKKLCFDNF